jgi:hypothetical protein
MYEDMTAKPELWAMKLAQFLLLEPESDAYRFLMEISSSQRQVKPDETTHTAYFLPGAHLNMLKHETLYRLY